MTPLLATPEVLPVDVPQLVAVTLSMCLLIIPVLGATIRFAIRPLVETLLRAGLIGQARGTAEPDKSVELLAHRVLELEQEVEKLKARDRAANPPDLNLVHPLEPVHRVR